MSDAYEDCANSDSDYVRRGAMSSSEEVRSAEPPGRSRVARDSVRNVHSSVLNPYALVYKPLASDVVHETGITDES